MRAHTLDFFFSSYPGVLSFLAILVASVITGELGLLLRVRLVWLGVLDDGDFPISFGYD